MIEADPNAGVYYVCNPNNPTGTITPRKKIEYLLANKKPDAIVVVDEAYIHFSYSAQPSSDLVASGKDVVVLRTFSKIYGIARTPRRFRPGPSRSDREITSLRYWHASDNRTCLRYRQSEG